MLQCWERRRDDPNRRILRQPVHLGRYYRGPQDCAMAGLYGLADCHDCA